MQPSSGLWMNVEYSVSMRIFRKYALCWTQMLSLWTGDSMRNWVGAARLWLTITGIWRRFVEKDSDAVLLLGLFFIRFVTWRNYGAHTEDKSILASVWPVMQFC